MSYIKNRVYTVSGVLAAAVADAGTFTVAYPTGTVQADFTAGLANPNGHYAVLNTGAQWNSSDADMSLSFGASNITVTNSSGETWAAGTEYVINIDVYDGPARIPICIPIALAGVTAADIVTAIRPGIDGYIEHMEFLVTTVVTTAAKAATLNAEIGTTNLTGGTIALTSANCTPLGATVAAAAITANNRITRKDTLSIEAASVTAFAEGAGLLIVYIRPDSEN